MSFIAPQHDFEIASMYDKLPLKSRIYLPSGILDSTTPFSKAAIIAHPYAALGGSYDDGIVMLCCEELLKAGFVVGTFNFRGAPGSAGKTSWSSAPELADYNSFATFMLIYMKIHQAISCTNEYSHVQSQPLKLILSGYSYGSTIVSKMSTAQTILEMALDSKMRAGTENYLNQIKLMRPQNPSNPAMLSRPTAGSFDLSMVDVAQAETAYFLICPLLPPLKVLLVPSSVRELWISTEKSFPVLVSQSTLIVIPETDTFTSTTRLMQWAARLKKFNKDLRYNQIANGDHFWKDQRAQTELRSHIRSWVQPPILTS